MDDGHNYTLNPNYDTSARNPDMHAVQKSMMDPVLAYTTPWCLNGLCKASGFSDMRKLPRCSNNCYRWVLGACEIKPGNPARCVVIPENAHPTAVQVPNDYVIQLKQALQLGVDNVLVEHGSKKNDT